MCALIETTRQRIATTVNAEICIMNWQIGKRIKEDILLNQRAEYGKQVVKQLAEKLTDRYGKGWSDRKLLHCIRSAYTFSEEEIVSAVRIQFTWTHLKSLMFIDDALKRTFYMEMCRLEHWDTRTLDKKIDSQLYELTAISKKPEIIIRQELDRIKATNTLTPDVVFRSGSFLDALGLPDIYSEKDLENSILNQIQSFIKELGTDFAFLDRQKRITVDSTDYYIDLLFYHRGLRRLVAIDLKLGKFKPEYEGQMLLYLRYLNKNERRAGEESPIGLILCSEGNTEHIEYLMLDDSAIKVAQYYTQLPDKKLLSEKLQRAIAIAREHHSEQEQKINFKII
ncbi:PDDEXK nuclease domain-containing protein [Candidatus Symbiothrix dinenymphae]|uniref:PDDEXK nuclease domain-containing protein n=1 Tax=Candidatus Symbiothrix dinenymphae TaxID=467085 RepID=UPI001D03D815|nr:PDDEXK nuclease domain-containing protein [Candidatus Symbiothrix dinenymphae]